MRVTIVSRIYRPEPSAASFFLGAVADTLINRGHEVHVLTARPPRALPAPRPQEDVRTFPVLRDRDGYVRGYLQYMSFDLPLALRLLTMPRPDVVLVEPPPTTGLVVRVVCALRRIPYVYDAADVWSDAAAMATRSHVVLRLLRRVERAAMNGARALVTISEGVVDRVHRIGVSTPAIVTGFGADTHEFSLAPTSRQKLFLYAGSYSAWHGADIMVDAFAEFNRTHAGYTLRIIGSGTERAALEGRVHAHGLGDQVEFLDPVPAAELSRHFTAAVASVATLRPGTPYEYAFATKTYSSLAAGCPVIFAGPGPTGPFLDAANEHVPAGIVSAYVAADIAAAMRNLADGEIAHADRLAIRAWIEKNHSMAAVSNRVADVLTSVVATRQRRAA